MTSLEDLRRPLSVLLAVHSVSQVLVKLDLLQLLDDTPLSGEDANSSRIRLASFGDLFWLVGLVAWS